MMFDVSERVSKEGIVTSSRKCLFICLEGLEKNRERVSDVLAEMRTGHLLFKNQKRGTSLDHCGDCKLLKEDALPGYHGGESSGLWYRLVW
jgi:hypothetical protein